MHRVASLKLLCYCFVFMYVHYLKDAVFKWKRVYSIYYEMHLQNLFIGKV